jgi:hypothetical protein
MNAPPCDASSDGLALDERGTAAPDGDTSDALPPPDVSTDASDAAPSDGALADTSTVDRADSGLEPIRVIRGAADETHWHDLVVMGQGFSGLDGVIVTIRSGDPSRPPERLGSGQVRIDQGAFSIRLPAAVENSLYKRKIVHVDADGDGACTDGDFLFADYGFADSNPPLDYVLMVSPTSPFRVLPDGVAKVCAEIQNWPLQ